MSNPYLVLGGVVAGIVVASFGILQVPGWVAEAQDAAAQHDLATVVGAQAAAVSDLGHGAASFEELAQSDFANIKLTPGVEIILDGTTDNQGVVAVSQTGRAFARVNGETMYRAESLPMLLKNRAFACDWEQANLRDIGQQAGACAPPPKGTQMVFTVRCDKDTDFNLPYSKFSGDAYWDGAPESSEKVSSSTNSKYVKRLKAGETHQLVIDGDVKSYSSDSGRSASRACIRSVDDIVDANGRLNGAYLFAWMSNLTSVPATAPQLTSDASYMFSGASSFNSDISKWNTSMVSNMDHMFTSTARFNSDISRWDTRNVVNMNGMFWSAASFNRDIDKWNVSKVEDFTSMFQDAKAFNGNVGSWNTSSGKTFLRMFSGAKSFNQDIGRWDVRNGNSFGAMFQNTDNFNQNISGWNVSHIQSFSEMFWNAKAFNQDISRWDVSGGTNFYRMFSGADKFNQNIGNWDVSNGTDFRYMFSNTTVFNQDIGNWDVGNGKTFSNMFFKASAFNQDLGDWDVRNATDFSNMFAYATVFNHDLGSWDVRNGTNFTSMFMGATVFDQDLSSWVTKPGAEHGNFANGAGNSFNGLSPAKYPKFS